MADYHAIGAQLVAASADTTLSIERGTGGRFKVYDFTSGFDLASPSDNLFVVSADRFGTTDDGTGDAEVGAPLDTADAAFSGNILVNHTVEPASYLATEVWNIAQHMRATYRWVAAPGKEIVMPDTANTGIGFFTLHASAVPVHQLGVFFSGA